LTPCAFALATVARITVGSPAWKPQATFASAMCAMSASSSPRRHTPNASPMSQFNGKLTSASPHRSTSRVPRYQRPRSPMVLPARVAVAALRSGRRPAQIVRVTADP
jgi:hypothetical protein